MTNPSDTVAWGHFPKLLRQGQFNLDWRRYSLCLQTETYTYYMSYRIYLLSSTVLLIQDNTGGSRLLWDYFVYLLSYGGGVIQSSCSIRVYKLFWTMKAQYRNLVDFFSLRVHYARSLSVGHCVHSFAKDDNIRIIKLWMKW